MGAKPPPRTSGSTRTSPPATRNGSPTACARRGSSSKSRSASGSNSSGTSARTRVSTSASRRANPKNHRLARRRSGAAKTSQRTNLRHTRRLRRAGERIPAESLRAQRLDTMQLGASDGRDRSRNTPKKRNRRHFWSRFRNYPRWRMGLEPTTTGTTTRSSTN